MLTALIAYLHYEAPVEEQNFATLLEMLNTMQVLEDDEEYQNPVDLLFEELAKKKPNSFAGRQYKLYKLAAGVYGRSTTFIYKGETTMEFFNSAIEVLQTLVVALGAGLGVWGAINLLEGYGNDNPGSNAHVR